MAELTGVDMKRIKLFLAGEYWLRESFRLASNLGYGVLYENDNDLTVKEGKSVG